MRGPAGPNGSVIRWLFALAAVALVTQFAFAGFDTSMPLPSRGTAGMKAAGSSGAVQPQVPAVSELAGFRIPADQLQALVFLCHRGPGPSGSFDLGSGHSVFGPVKELPLTRAEQASFDRQWAAAVAASKALATPEQATAAGYVPAAPFNPGVGTHWIKWSLVGRPFDPATPSMLLFDGMPGRPVELVGFAYWVESTKPPTGFAGPNDRWHRHAGLCFNRNGWLGDQNVPNQAACKGYWFSGRNLWMLHAWVVPDRPNIWGNFAPTNPYLCPPVTNDAVSCA